MAERTHLAKQEEAITERGTQIRASDPLVPLEDQQWWNTTEGKLKLRKGGVTRIFKEVLPSVTLIGTTINFISSSVFRKDIAAGETYDFSNAVDGDEITLILRNTSGGAFDVGFSGIQNAGDVSVRIRAGATQVYKFSVNGAQIFCTSPLYQEGTYAP